MDAGRRTKVERVNGHNDGGVKMSWAPAPCPVDSLVGPGRLQFAWLGCSGLQAKHLTPAAYAVEYAGVIDGDVLLGDDLDHLLSHHAAHDCGDVMQLSAGGSGNLLCRLVVALVPRSGRHEPGHLGGDRVGRDGPRVACVRRRVQGEVYGQQRGWQDALAGQLVVGEFFVC